MRRVLSEDMREEKTGKPLLELPSVDISREPSRLAAHKCNAQSRYLYYTAISQSYIIHIVQLIVYTNPP